jgi:hypothetical protein
MATKQQIVNDIDAHIKKQGGGYGSWYVGITGDIDDRLHGAHKVPKQNHWYITRQGDSHTIARAAEKVFIDAGCKGGGGGGDDNSSWVYAYLITGVTVE